jgi:hypothetical protein
MGLMAILAAAHDGSFIANAGAAAGVEADKARPALAALTPAIAEKLKERVQDEAAFEALLDLLEDGNGDLFLDEPALMTDKEVTADGRAILKDLYGTQARATAAGVALTGLTKTQVGKLMPLAAASVLAALARANGAGGQAFLGSGSDSDSSGGLLGTLVKAVVEGAVREVSRQFAPKRRRRRYTGYSSYRRKRRKTTTRRTRRPSLESIFQDILSGR